jgi:hypothetical protein
MYGSYVMRGVGAGAIAKTYGIHQVLTHNLQESKFQQLQGLPAAAHPSPTA